MKKVLFLIFISAAFATKAQKSSEDVIFTSVESPPTYIGGNEALFKVICQNLVVPKEIPINSNLNKVFVKFVVEKDGSVSHPEILKGINDECNKEAIRVVNLLP